MQLSLTTKTSAIIVVVAFVIVFIGTTTLSLSVDRLQNSYLVSKQFQLLDLLNSVVIELTRGEAGEKEYLLTGKSAAKDRFYFAFSQIEADISKLKVLFSDRSEYVMLLEDLTESLSFRKSCAEEVMSVRDASGLQAAMERSHRFDEEGMTQHVEWLAKDVSRTINREMTERFSDLDRDNLNSMGGIFVILCSSLVALLLLKYGVNRYVEDRQEAEAVLNQARDALAEREARMRALVSTAPDGIVTVTTDGIIETSNAVFDQMFGFNSAQPVGLSVESILPGFMLGFSSADGPEGSAAVKQGNSGVRELSGLTRDGLRVPVEISISNVSRGEETVLIGIVRDVTERKAVEERVRDFYSMVSHELRTPLASIRTALGLLETNFAGALPEGSMPVVKIAADEADRLMRLINDILDMRKIEAGKMELYSDSYKASELVNRALEGLSTLSDEALVCFHLALDESIEVFCDYDRTLQVLSNLLSNAIKYSPPQGQIDVELSNLSGFCRFSVRDYGPGVPKNQTHKLFARFEQLRSSDGQYRSGTGLGLAIAKAMVEAQGGQIGVDLPDDGGSLFWFTLPLSLPDSEDEEALEIQEVTEGQSIDADKEESKEETLSQENA
ncbi:MAG: PAS domain S-box protein [Candidatus Obscuribacterales bacterium]|nr:PAS domain S-box protein [Candidatus Obscuribacterales bacterium]